MLRFLTAGESHGKALLAIIEGFPAGLELDEAKIDLQLKRRMSGYGRGGRMKIESDSVEILAGVKGSLTVASPIALRITNRDHTIDELPPVSSPRPGHADLAGLEKYAFSDARCVLERASARETAARVAAGAIARIFLEKFGVTIISHVKTLGGVQSAHEGLSFEDIAALSEASSLRCADKRAEKKMKDLVDAARENGDTLGGSFEVLVRHLPPGLGSYVHWDRRLDGKLARAVMSIPAVKAVSIGEGVDSADRPGSSVHDEIFQDSASGKLVRSTNRAGGLEGGMTNGCVLSVTGYMKPIATLGSALRSVDISSGKSSSAAVERSDVTAVPACAVIGEAVIAMELAGAFLEKFGSDSMQDIRESYERYKSRLRTA